MALSKGKKIVVGMSGGVDSSVAAALLKEKGYDVIGVTFRMWPKEECGTSYGRSCCSLEAITRARSVAERLNIPYYVYDFSSEFKKEVIEYFSSQYAKGLTPNPCIICNEKIKFGVLLDKAKSLGASLVATGHYARTGFDKRTGRFLLKEGKDKFKDQSYFLSRLSQRQLEAAVFPLGDITKTKVRSLAGKLKLATSNTVSSQDICFTQGMEYGEYIKKKAGVEPRTGEIVDKIGKVLGSHKGAIFYTIGQRRGLGVAHTEPLYVTGIDAASNRVIVGTKNDAMSKTLVAEKLNWIAIDRFVKPLKVMAMIRYNSKKAKAIVRPEGRDTVRVDFSAAQFAPTPGQAVVFYDKDIVIGSGWISIGY